MRVIGVLPLKESIERMVSRPAMAQPHVMINGAQPIGG